MGRGDPKTECWYIMSAEPGAVLYKGLKSGVTREAFAEAIRQGTVAELLGRVSVEAGECHFLPAGTAHSIGAGLLIAEIQTPSDTTYRVFDWNRVDDSGRPRQLHIEEALESINFEAAGEELPVTTVGRLVDSEYFKIDRGHQGSNCEVLVSPGLMRTLIIIKGLGRIMGDWLPSLEFKGGDCLLIPAACEGVIKFVEETEYLTITI
jgi:mannose-6-phosphate isomerase